MGYTIRTTKNIIPINGNSAHIPPPSPLERAGERSLRISLLALFVLLITNPVYAQQKHPIVFPSDTVKSAGIPTIHKPAQAKKPEPKPIPPRQAPVNAAKKKEDGRFNPYL